MVKYLSPSVSSFVSVFVTFGFRYGSFTAGFNKFNLQYKTNIKLKTRKSSNFRGERFSWFLHQIHGLFQMGHEATQSKVLAQNLWNKVNWCFKHVISGTVYFPGCDAINRPQTTVKISQNVALSHHFKLLIR